MMELDQMEISEVSGGDGMCYADDPPPYSTPSSKYGVNDYFVRAIDWVLLKRI